MQDLFETYQDAYDMVNINSGLMPEILALQKFKIETKGMHQAKKQYEKLSKRYFYYDSQSTAHRNFIRQLKDIINPDHWNDTQRNESELAFLVDMDAQFIFVPKAWTQAVMKIRLLSVLA